LHNAGQANIFAVTFLLSKKENRKKIKYIETSLEQVIKILPKIDFNNLSEEAYFNANYMKLGNDINAYGYFQFRFILNILKSKKRYILHNLLVN
jgi:Zn-dependent peptidase ImmA (M78 family)